MSLRDFYIRHYQLDVPMLPKHSRKYRSLREWLNRNGYDLNEKTDNEYLSMLELWENKKRKKQSFTTATARITQDEKVKWQTYLKEKGIKSESELIKKSVEFYIDSTI